MLDVGFTAGSICNTERAQHWAITYSGWGFLTANGMGQGLWVNSVKRKNSISISNKIKKQKIG